MHDIPPILRFEPVKIKNREPVNDKELDFDKAGTVRTAKQRMMDALQQPAINPLIGDIWQSGELHLHFADTGIGKSILAVTWADYLTKGKKFFGLENTNKPLKGILYDFELSDRQFYNRYSDKFGNLYDFNDNFFIINIDFPELSNLDGNRDFDSLLFSKMEKDIEELEPDFIIIDNITFLNTQTTHKTDIALEVMRKLTEIKRYYNLSILVLAHTPKIDLFSPLTVNSMAGSKHLSNFADSVSAMGKSVLGSDIRYIKQIKPSRSGEYIYDTNNVITCQLIKSMDFLTFEFIGYDSEYQHLKRQPKKEQRQNNIEKAMELRENGKTLSEIAEIILGDPTKKGTISKWLKENND